MSDGQATLEGDQFKNLITANLAALAQQFTISLEISPVEINVIGDIAVDRGHYTLVLTPKDGGEATELNVRCLEVWKKGADGVWRVWQAINNNEAAHNWPPTLTTSN